VHLQNSQPAAVLRTLDIIDATESRAYNTENDKHGKKQPKYSFDWHFLVWNFNCIGSIHRCHLLCFLLRCWLSGDISAIFDGTCVWTYKIGPL